MAASIYRAINSLPMHVFDLSATNIKALAAGSYTFSYNATTEKMTVTFTAASDPTPDPTQTPDA